MRRWGALVGAALLVILLAGAPAAGATGRPTGAIRVHAQRSATVLVKLPKLTVDWSSLTVSPSVGAVAVYFEPLAGGVPADSGSGGFVADALKVEDEPSMVLGLGSLDFRARPGDGPRFAVRTTLPAGAYLLHVLTAKPLTLTLPTPGSVRTINVTADGPSLDRMQLRPLLAVPGTGAPGAGYDRAALSQPRHAMTRTMTILRTESATERHATSLSGCRQETAGADSAPSAVTVLGKLPACGPGDDGDGGWALYDASRRTYEYDPPVPVLIPIGAVSTYVWMQYYERPVPQADQLAEVSSLDSIKDATAASVVVALRR